MLAPGMKSVVGGARSDVGICATGPCATMEPATCKLWPISIEPTCVIDTDDCPALTNDCYTIQPCAVIPPTEYLTCAPPAILR